MADHLPFAELRRIAEYSTDSAAILDAIDALERAEPIAEAARTFVTARRRFYNFIPTQRPDDVAWATLAAAVDAEHRAALQAASTLDAETETT